MCREIANGGRRCPCSRGDRRRAYQRMRYAARQAAAAAPATTETPDLAPSRQAATLAELEQRRTQTAAAVDGALAALRDPERSSDPDVHDAYLDAVLDHGAVIRDIAHHYIDAAYAEQGFDEASVNAEAAAVAARLQQVEADWHAAKTRTDSYVSADGSSFISEQAAAAIDTAHNSYIAAKQDIYKRAVQRSNEINAARVRIAKQAYYRELARERSFGGADFMPSNHAKMTKADRAMFDATTALYPDEMVEHTTSLGPLLAKRSKARAHYNPAARQRTRRTRSEVFDLNDALQYGRFRFSHYVDSAEDAACGKGSIRDRYSAASVFVERTTDNERRARELVAQYNEGRRQHATVEYITVAGDSGGEAREMIYVKGPRKRVTTEVTAVSAELTFSDPCSMAHEMGHRIEDRVESRIVV